MLISTPRLKHRLRSLSFLGLFIALAYLTTLYPLTQDVTHNAGNSLSEASKKLLTTLPDTITLTAYIKQGEPLRLQIANLVDRYRAHKANIKLSFIDPTLDPVKARELNISSEGAVIVEYQGRSEKLSFIDESSLTNALLQLANANEQWITFLSGHGERSPETAANFDVSELAKELQRRNIQAQSLNLATLSAIPNNSDLLIITAPRVALIPEEIKLIKDYIEQGGNLLLLSDPDVSFLNDLFAQLGIEQLAGEIINHHSTLDDPSFIVASQYPPHPITKDLLTTTLYPVVAVLKLKPNSAFKAQALLSSSDKSSLSSNNSPVYQSFVFAYALTRNISTNKQQRIVVVGDGDFLANAYIGNVGNLDMGLRMITWLIHEDRFIDIPAKIANDKSLQLNKKQVAIIGIGFLLVMPLVLISSGVIIWRSRRRK